MALGIGMRTIWVALRAANYSKPAFDQASGSVKKLTEDQKALIAQQRALARNATQMIGVGLMYVAMGAMVGFTMAKLIGMSREGSQYMERFAQTAQQAGGAIGTALLETLKPLLDVLSTFLKFIAENKAFARMIANLMLLATTFLLFNGIIKTATGVTKLFGLTSGASSKGLISLKGGIDLTNLSAKTLLATLGQLMLIFYISYSIATALSEALGGPLQAAIVMLIPLFAVLVGMLWAGASAMSVLTWGAAAAAGIGGMLALQAIGPPSYQTGTRFAQRTQMAVVHAGEKITPARDVIDSQPQTISHTTNTFDFSGTTIQTKADKEELLPWMKRAVRDAMRGKE